jgi:hypothetical protein
MHRRRRAQLSLIDLLPIHTGISEDHLLVVLKSYFDGGNQADSSRYDVLSLASISGTPSQWRAFEREWKATLKTHNNTPWLHTTDALTLNDPYTKANGWDESKVQDFISGCVQVIENHLTIPNIEDRSKPGRDGLFSHVISVVLKDFIRARDACADLPKTVEEICATQSVAMVFERGKAKGADFYYLTFDQNEAFMGHVLDRQRNRKARKHLQPVVGRILGTGEADMRDVPALQVADVLAWSYSHKRNKPLYPWQQTLLKHYKWVDDWYEYDDLLKLVPGVSSLVKSWNLPPRTPTR